MALTTAQMTVVSWSSTSGASQQLGILSLIGNGIIVPIEFGDITSTILSVGDQLNGLYTLVQGPNRLAAQTTYCYYLPVVELGGSLLEITIKFSNIVSNVIFGLSEFVAPDAVQLLAQAQSDVLTQISNLIAAIRAQRGF